MPRPEEQQPALAGKDDFRLQQRMFESELAVWDKMRALTRENPDWAFFRAFWENEAKKVDVEAQSLRGIHRPEVQERYIELKTMAATLRGLFSKPEQMAADEERGRIVKALDQLAQAFKTFIGGRQ
jgi:hypothetical protein